MALYRVCAILGDKLTFLRNRRIHQGSDEIVLDVADIVFRAVEVVIYRHQRIVGEFFQPVLNRPCRPFPPADTDSNVIKLTMIKRFELIILLTRHKAVQNRSVYPLQRWLLPDYG